MSEERTTRIMETIDAVCAEMATEENIAKLRAKFPQLEGEWVENIDKALIALPFLLKERASKGEKFTPDPDAEIEVLGWWIMDEVERRVG